MASHDNLDSRLKAIAERTLQKNLERNETNGYRPRATVHESKAERTTAAAKALIDQEARRREQKTAALRAARLKREAAASREDRPEKKRQK